MSRPVMAVAPRPDDILPRIGPARFRAGRGGVVGKSAERAARPGAAIASRCGNGWWSVERETAALLAHFRHAPRPTPECRWSWYRRATNPSARKLRLEPSISSAQPPVQLGHEFDGPPLAQRTLPYNCDSPTGCEQLVAIAPVTLHVGVELRLPEFRSRGRGGRVWATCMSVPEAAVDEAHGSESRKHQVGGAGKLALVQAISETAGMESPTQYEFG